MLVRFNASENGPSAALNATEQRQREALAALGGLPGVVDITWGKIGDRWGFVVSMDRPADLNLEISSELFKGKVTASYLASQSTERYFQGTSTYHAAYSKSMEELGISRQMMRGRSITAP